MTKYKRNECVFVTGNRENGHRSLVDNNKVWKLAICEEISLSHVELDIKESKNRTRKKNEEKKVEHPFM